MEREEKSNDVVVVFQYLLGKQWEACGVNNVIS